MSDITEVTGIVLSAMPVGEFDRRIVILTKERGKIAAFAKGARRPNSPLTGITRPFVFGTFQVYEGRTSYTIRQANITAYFEEIISDFDAVCYAYYFAELADYDIGLAVTEIRIQDAEPPTAEVIEAFREVETAKQDKETAINVANAYQNSEIPKAEAESDKVLKEAEYYRQDRINEAKKQVAMFNAMYGEYALNPQITKKRMYFEAIEKVLPGVKIYIDASDGTTQKLLPLESFAGTGDNN